MKIFGKISLIIIALALLIMPSIFNNQSYFVTQNFQISENIVLNNETANALEINVNVLVGENGTVTPSGLKKYNYGDTLEVYVSADNCYQLSVFTVNGINRRDYIYNNYYHEILTQDIEIVVEFSKSYWKDYVLKPAGNGTEQEPYLITNANELSFISYSVNRGVSLGNGVNYKDAYYKLSNSITLKGRFFEPIGTAENKFSGTFDYNNYKIYDIRTDVEGTELLYDGLFNEISESASIINLASEKQKKMIIICVIGVSGILLVALVIVIIVESRRKKPKKAFYVPVHIKINVDKTEIDKKN